MADAVENTKVGRSVSAAENFLFLELPASMASGELLAAGWRGSSIGNAISSKFLPWMGRSIFGLDTATTINASRLIMKKEYIKYYCMVHQKDFILMGDILQLKS